MSRMQTAPSTCIDPEGEARDVEGKDCLFDSRFALQCKTSVNIITYGTWAMIGRFGWPRIDAQARPALVAPYTQIRCAP